MKYNSKLLASVISVASLALSIGFAPARALAADNGVDRDQSVVVDISNSEYKAQAEKAVNSWKNNKKMTALSDRAGGSKTVKAYRGSFLMWSEETINFDYSGHRVTWSSGYQKTGAIFPNNITANGTKRVYSSSWNHRWRGSYTVGAGIPTPWGNANVYNETSVITTNVYGNGSYNYSWDN